MVRVVLDTNILIASAYAPASASRRIVSACIEGRLSLIVSGAIRIEYDRLEPRAVRLRPAELRAHRERMSRLLDSAELVEPDGVDRVVPEDPEDDKFVAAALAGAADVLVSNDRHLLALDPLGRLRILRPRTFEDWLNGT